MSSLVTISVILDFGEDREYFHLFMSGLGYMMCFEAGLFLSHMPQEAQGLNQRMSRVEKWIMSHSSA